MFMRTFSATVMLLFVAGCSDEPIIESKFSQLKAADKIECALGGAEQFAFNCAIERGEGVMLILRHSDGGFRRLTLETDGTIDTADGANAITLNTLDDGRTEVTVGDDRYRLPANL
jgi:hypothetical protein